MRKTTRTLCQQCKYSLSNGNGSGSKYAVTCAYLEITKKRRNREVGLCDKFEAKKKKAEQALVKMKKGV
ncbi:MAG: hypothetical protein IJF03_09990 [Lachnospiraceae bacterium]|nr:hypothetical protein [Lachnospiraceae bacterium]